MRSACRRCGGAKDTGCPHSWYCSACHTAREAEWIVARHVCSHPRSDVPHWQCEGCWNVKQANRRAASQRAMVTRAERHPSWKRPRHAEAFWQRYAHRLVAQAKKAGILPLLDGSIACADCGEPARIYEHRDYSRPLDVVPVCASCNRKRGTAVWPSADQFHFRKVGH